MNSYSYQNLESKRCPTAVVLGATALLSVSVGAVVGLLTSAQTSDLYVSTTAAQATANTVAVAPQESVTRLQATELKEVTESNYVEHNTFVSPQAPASWTTLGALIAAPVAMATYFLRKSENQKRASLVDPIDLASTGAVWRMMNVVASPELYEKVRNIVCEELGIDKEKATPNANVQELGADSLDLVELIMKLEEDFGIEIPEEVSMKITTIQEAADAVAKQQAK
jgi:acyl carrier protein